MPTYLKKFVVISFNEIVIGFLILLLEMPTNDLALCSATPQNPCGNSYPVALITDQ